MQCEHFGCNRRGRVKFDEAKYCIKHYNACRRRAKREKDNLGKPEKRYNPEREVAHLRNESHRLVACIKSAVDNQKHCRSIQCGLIWRNRISKFRVQLDAVLLEATRLEEGDEAMGKEKSWLCFFRKWVSCKTKYCLSNRNCLRKRFLPSPNILMMNSAASRLKRFGRSCSKIGRAHV